MKIQCNVCEMAEAKVLCCADEAALCWACDEKVHAANKLAGKHQRVPLTGSSSQVPKCDICKEASGYFFCLEDRALLCRKCDTSIHTMNLHVSAHQRFLLTGVKIGSEPAEQLLFTRKQSIPLERNTESTSKPACKSSSMPVSQETCQVAFSQVDENRDFPNSEVYFSGGVLSGSTYDWPQEDILDFTNFSHYGFMEHESSKADGGKLESLGGSPTCSSADEERNNELFCQVPEMHWYVPDMPSPPTASGLNWPKNSHRKLVEDSVFVPDISYTSQDLQQCQRGSPVRKRRQPC